MTEEPKQFSTEKLQALVAAVFHSNALQKDPDAVNTLISLVAEQGLDLNFTFTRREGAAGYSEPYLDEQTPITAVIQFGMPETLEHLVACGARADFPTRDGTLPLTRAQVILKNARGGQKPSECNRHGGNLPDMIATLERALGKTAPAAESSPPHGAGAWEARVSSPPGRAAGDHTPS